MAVISRDDHSNSHHGISGWGIFFIVLLILAIIAGAGFFLYIRMRKRRQPSSDYPSPAPRSIGAWFTDTFAKLKRGRTRQTGAGYEGTGGNGGYGAGGYGGSSARRGHLDTDEAWDANVANEAYYEEQELGLQAPTGYTGAGYGGYGAPSPGFEPAYPATGLTAPAGERGRSKSRERELDARYAEETEQRENPFGDEHAAPSIRSVSPRPIDTSAANAGKKGKEAHDNSPTERRSMFREEM
jgi:hypothetical protein